MKPLSNPKILFMMLNVQLTIVIPKSRDHMISSRNKKVDVLTIPTYHRMYPLDNLLCPYLLFNSSFNKFVLSTNYAQGILEYYESANMVTGDITCSCIKMPNFFFSPWIWVAFWLAPIDSEMLCPDFPTKEDLLSSCEV